MKQDSHIEYLKMEGFYVLFSFCYWSEVIRIILSFIMIFLWIYWDVHTRFSFFVQHVLVIVCYNHKFCQGIE